MRRKDREITDVDRIEQVVAGCRCIRLGFNDGGEVYIVPVNFGYERREGSFTFYFHGAKEGRKYDLLCRSPRVGFEMDTGYALKRADAACGHSARFQSVIGTADASIIEDPAEKRRALSLIMAQATGRGDWEFPDAAVQKVGVFKLTADQLSCKEHE